MVEKVSSGVEARVRQAERELQKARFLQMTGGPKPKAQVRNAIKTHEASARRLLREAEDLARSEDETAWFEQAIRETEALALARGEVVGELPIAGTKAKRKVMLSRGMGLEHARDNGYLAAAHGKDETDALYEIGARYKAAFEVVEGLVTHKGEGGGGFGPKGYQLRLAEAGDFLAVARGAMTPRQRAIVDAVCGKGWGMFEAAKACRMGVPSSRNALRGGLQAALEAVRKARRVAEGQDRPGDVAAVNDAVAQALHAA